MASEELIYSNDTLISPHTNQPISEDVKPVIFWCKVCSKKLNNPFIVRKHMSSKRHLDRLNLPVKESESKPKIVRQPPVVKTEEPANKKPQTDVKTQEPANKKPRTDVKTQEHVNKKPRTVAEKSIIKCEDCKLEFVSEHNALHHFKGKRHKKTITAKVSAKLNRSAGNQSGGYGSRGGNRSSGEFGKGISGLMSGINPGGMGNRGGGQLQTTDTWRDRSLNALQNYGGGQGNNQLSWPREYGGGNGYNVPRTNEYGNDYYSNNSQNFSVNSFQNVGFDSSMRYQRNNNFAGELKSSLTSEIFRLKRRLNQI